VRVDVPEEPSAVTTTPRRAKHDSIQSSIATTSRTEIGAVTSAGRLVRMTPLDLPVVPENSVQLGAGVRIRDYLGLSDKKERVLALVDLASPRSIALGTAQGVVKRVVPGDWANRPEFELVTLKKGDTVVGAAQGEDTDDLVFVTSDAQLLRFAASSVRPQGRAAGGMAGINLSTDATVLSFGSVAATDDTVVVTIAGSSDTLPGADAGSGKVSSLAEFPAKGRATAGVRAHRFLRGEDTLLLAWSGPAPALASGSDGSVRELPAGGAKRDASGVPLAADVAYVGTSRIHPPR
jgi:DNA gyrase subunit A